MATVDNQTVVVPNSILTSNSLTNVTARPERKLDLKVGISYDADMKQAKHIIEEILHRDLSVIQDEEIVVFVSDLADSAVMIGLRAWVKTEEYWAARWRILEQIKTEFDQAGIEIPTTSLRFICPVTETVRSHADKGGRRQRRGKAEKREERVKNS